MKHIINENGTVNTVIYELRGVKYQIVGSRSNGSRAMDCMDTIKNLETSKYKDIARYQLFKYTR